jgi:hypothetical protein
MIEPLKNQKEIISKYADGPGLLEAAVAALSNADLDAALSDNSWTIRQIIHHLADGDEIWRIFVKNAIGNPGGSFSLEWYGQMTQDEWVRLWAYEVRDLSPSLALIRAGRHQVIQLLEYIPDAWGKSMQVRWPDGSVEDVNVGWVVEMQSRHLEAHLDDIRRILTA